MTKLNVPKILSLFLLFSAALSPVARAHSPQIQIDNMDITEVAARYQVFNQLFLEEFEKELAKPDLAQPKALSLVQFDKIPSQAGVVTDPVSLTVSAPATFHVQIGNEMLTIRTESVLTRALKRYREITSFEAGFPLKLVDPKVLESRWAKIYEAIKRQANLKAATEFFAETSGKIARSGIVFGVTFFGLEALEHSFWHSPVGTGPLCAFTLTIAGILSSWTAPLKYLSIRNPHPIGLIAILKNAVVIPLQRFKFSRQAKRAEINDFVRIRQSDKPSYFEKDPVEAAAYDSKLWWQSWLSTLQKKWSPIRDKGCSGDCASCCRNKNLEADSVSIRQSLVDLENGKALSMPQINQIIGSLILPMEILRNTVDLAFEGQGISKVQYMYISVWLGKYEKLIDQFETSLEILHRNPSGEWGPQHRAAIESIIDKLLQTLDLLQFQTVPSVVVAGIKVGDAAPELSELTPKLEAELKAFRRGKHLCEAVLEAPTETAADPAAEAI